MHFRSLTKFLALVTPERLEAYLREKGWTQRSANDTVHQWWKSGPANNFIVTVWLRTILAGWPEALAAQEQRPEVSVLYDLLPPEHRGEMVKAVFPGLKEAAP